ncbi:MAG: hypothetical protein DI586_10180 [Micavibrio aeruginosavorus]|uniref:HPt domain-containing protein n=1 Tax=Micavibrio aeruginosavorus TaxID=349221 RepID=A0A2W5FDW8_9BACT|nr:MAG: hypothetical protein DI586_10180 [Micavibrio aeruginosavorus]
MTDSNFPEEPCGMHEDTFGEVLARKTITDEMIDNALLVDEKQLSELIKLIGLDTFNAIMDDFKIEITQRFEAMSSLQDNPHDLAKELHIITSCGGNLGMSKFSLLARQTMNKIDRSQPVDIPLALRRIQEMYEDSLKLFMLRSRT